MRAAGLVLAAGASSRMGSAKALLAWRGTSLLGFAVAQMRAAGVGVGEIVVVLGVAHDEIEGVVPELRGTIVRLNLDESSGRSASIRIGALAIGDSVARVIVQSVDQPCEGELIRRLLETEGEIVAPARNGRRGHPVCFSGRLLGELRSVSEETEGLRAVVRRHAVTEVEVASDAVFWNLNTPEAYQAAVARQQ
jgi:molybdenum cofactor cytidylyltransferase